MGDPDVGETFRGVFDALSRSIYTISFVRVESVDEDNRRAEVSLKSDSDVTFGNVPIASIYAGDGTGLIVPIEQDDEGFLLHAREPLEQHVQQRGELDPGSSARFELEDAIFFPQIWFDEDDVPDHEAGEIVLEHEGTVVRVDDDGDVAIEHVDGSSLEMDAAGVHIEPELYVSGTAFSDLED